MATQQTDFKETTRQVYLQKINQSIDYITRNLPTSLTLYDLADMAALSPYHSHRVFAQLAGETPGHLLTRYRLEKGAFLLRYSKADCRQIARQIGYDSKDSFAKAFKKLFGLTPKTYRVLSEQSMNTEALVDQRLTERLWRMFEESFTEIRPAQQVLYLRGNGFENGHYNKIARAVWPRLLAYVQKHQLVQAQMEYLTCFPHCTVITQAQQCAYEACITLTDHSFKPSGEFGIHKLEGGKFMVFPHYGPYKQLYESWQAIYQCWLPISEQQLRPAAAFEVYPQANGFRTRQPGFAHLYLPIL